MASFAFVSFLSNETSQDNLPTAPENSEGAPAGRSFTVIRIGSLFRFTFTS